LLLPQNGADWRADLTGRQLRGRHLVQQRLKQVMIRAVDQNDLRSRVLQRLGRCQAAESTADDYNYRKMVAHI